MSHSPHTPYSHVLVACCIRMLCVLSGSVFRIAYSSFVRRLVRCVFPCVPLGRAHHLSGFWCNSFDSRMVKGGETLLLGLRDAE